jgi:hypothetical protein
LKVSEYGVFRAKDEKRLSGAEEADVFKAVGLPLIPPELREDRGEIQAAEKGKLPRLIEGSDIRGDLQMHTTASDGKNSILEMARKAKEMGYAYIAITDPQGVRVAGGWMKNSWLPQRIEKPTASFRASDSKGVEVDILPDGSLDLKDDILGARSGPGSSLFQHGREDDPAGDQGHQKSNVKSPTHGTADPGGAFKINLRKSWAAIDQGLPKSTYPTAWIEGCGCPNGQDLMLGPSYGRSQCHALELRNSGFTTRRGWIEARITNTHSARTLK